MQDIFSFQVPDDRRHESAYCDPDSAYTGPGPAARHTDPASAAGIKQNISFCEKLEKQALLLAQT